VPGSPITPVVLRSSNLPTPARALAIGAHPDDVEFGCGATLAKWAVAGCEIHHLICTDGSKGTWDVHADLAALVATRQDEQRAAARVLGATGEVLFLGRVDGELEADRGTCSEIARWIRRLRPDVLLGHDPWKRYRLHPDHRAAGVLTCDALVAARDPHFFAEHGIAHHRPSALLLFEADAPDHIEDVSGFGDAKLGALEAHQSQFESTMFVTTDDGGDHRAAELARFRRGVRDELAETGRALGCAEGEAFKLMEDL
jgi:LmbE family N-acetylglucosaminyl deacetylase